MLGKEGNRLHGGPFCIVNAQSGRVLGLDDPKTTDRVHGRDDPRATDNGSAVTLSHYTGSPAQQWLLEEVSSQEWESRPFHDVKDSGLFRIVNVKACRVLDADNAHRAENGCKIHVWDRGTEARIRILRPFPNIQQVWWVHESGDCKYWIANLIDLGVAQVTRHLDGDRATLDDEGGRVQLWTPWAGENQLWYFYHATGDYAMPVHGGSDTVKATTNAATVTTRAAEPATSACLTVIGTDHRVYRWNGSAFEGDSAGATGTDIAVGPAGQTFLLNAGANNSIWRRDADAWTQIPGAALDLAVGGDGSFFVIGTDHRVYRWNGSGWEGDSAGGSGTKIAVGPSGQAFVLNAGANNSLWRRDSDQWTQIPGAALDLAVGDDGSLFVIGTDHRVYRWTGSGWEGDSAGATGTHIAAGPSGQLFVLNANADNSLWRRTPDGWAQVPGAALALGI